MKFLLYSNENNLTGHRLKTLLEGIITRANLVIFSDFDQFRQDLQKPQSRLSIAILVAEDQQELNGFIKIKELMEHFKLILVLPDGEDETLQAGHTLRPRFLTYADSDFADVAAVVTKMMDKAQMEAGI